MIKIWIVYMHENRANGKKYIGITCQKPEKRWQVGEGYKQCPLFYAAIQKYGWDSFRHDILYTGLTKEEAGKLEVELIEKHQSADPAKGYNLAQGGGVNCGFHRTEEFKQKLSRTRAELYAGANHNMYGTHRSEITKERIRSAQVGRPKSAEARERMSAAASRRWDPSNQTEREHLRQLNLAGNSALARAVLCVETGRIYPATREASRLTGVENSGIVRCCNGQRRTAGGYHWLYASEEVVSG